MKWVTRKNLHVDRTACAWLIRRFIDAEAEFLFVSSVEEALAADATPFDVRGVPLGHHDNKCTFQVMLDVYSLASDPALVEMGRIIGDADVPPSRTRRPEAAGLDALIGGFRTSVPDDFEKIKVTGPLYDALYAYCAAKIATPPPRQGAPRPRLRYGHRVEAHLEEGER